MPQLKKFLRRLDRERKQLVSANPKDRLAFLIRWADIKAVNFVPYEHRRHQRRWSWRKFNLALCWACGKAKRLIRHHVIQVKNGGNNDPRNVVAICAECHLEIHPWMDADEHPIITETREMDASPL